MIAHVVAALFNACWQSLALVGVTWLTLRFFSRSSAATRYAVWFAALIAVAALPAIDFFFARGAPALPVAAAAPSHYKIVQTGTVTYPVGGNPVGHAPRVKPTTTTIGYAVEAAPDPTAQWQVQAAIVATEVGKGLSNIATPLAFTWLFFSAILLCRLAFSYARLRRVKRGLTPLNDAQVDRLIAGSARPVVVGVADDLTMPCVLGFAKPAIALPAKLAAELASQDLERIIRHEHAHVRRWDDVANAIQLILQAVMCLNPAVHIIGRGLNVEREIACDDFAVEPLAERVQYAKCLTHIAVNGFNRRQALPAPGFFFNRKQLVMRVERLLERGHNGSTTIAATARYALAGLALVVVAVARVQLPVVAAPNVPTSAADPIRPTLATPVVQSARVVHAGRVVQPARAIRHIAHTAVASVRDNMTVVARPVVQVTVKPNLLSLRQSIRHTVKNVVESIARSRATFASAPAVWVAMPAAAHSAAVSSAAVAAAVASHSASSGEDFLDALSANGYKNLSVDALVQLKSVGVDGALIDAAVRYSGSRPGVELLVRLASVGVDADYLNQLRTSGYPRMNLDDVARMRSLGVDPDFIRNMTAALHNKPSIDQLMQLRALGVDPYYVRSFAKIGYDRLSPNDFMRLRSVGVDAEYVHMLRSKGIGGSNLSVEDLIRMKSAGVE